MFGFLEVWIRKEKEHLTELQKTETNESIRLPVICGTVQYLLGKIVALLLLFLPNLFMAVIVRVIYNSATLKVKFLKTTSLS